jgi:peroxiredoxin
MNGAAINRGFHARVASMEESPIPDALPEPLAARLAREAEATRARSPGYIAALERFVARLVAAKAGEAAPRVGQPMPPLLMPDHDGHLVRLDAILRKGPAVLVFHRGHWCPFCKVSMTALAEIQDRVGPARLHAISPQIAQYTRQMRDLSGAQFPFLTDIDAGYALSLGLAVWLDDDLASFHRNVGRDLHAYHGGGQWIVPIPAVFVVDRAGIVRARHVDPDYRRRMELDALLAAVKAVT